MMGHGMGPEKDYVEPDKENRQYYRHKYTGDLAYLVFRAGQPLIKYDRPNDTSTIPFKPEDWNLEMHAEPLGRTQAASIAFEADRALCGFLGMPLQARREWRMLSHKDRIDFVKEGPKGDGSREVLYRSIMKALKPLTRPE